MAPVRHREIGNNHKGKEKWVILGHGVLRSSSSMKKIKKKLSGKKGIKH